MKICAIFTGGTIGSSFTEDGYISADKDQKKSLIELYQKRYGDTHEFTVRTPYYILSENLDAKHLNLLIQEIETTLAIGGYDCVLVMHGTDTLPYTAAALGLLYEKCGVPVILVSADFPLSDERSNGLDNFAAAVRFAEVMADEKKSGVFVAYCNKEDVPRIHSAQYVLEQQFMSADVRSIDNMYYGSFDCDCNDGSDSVSIKKDSRVFRKNPSYNETFLCDTISVMRDRVAKAEGMDFEGFYLPDSCPVLRIFAYPGIKYPTLDAGIKSVLIKGFHSGTVARDEGLETFASQCRMRGISLYIAGLRADESAYESTKIYEELGIKPLNNMTDIGAFMFLWFSAGID